MATVNIRLEDFLGSPGVNRVKISQYPAQPTVDGTELVAGHGEWFVPTLGLATVPLLLPGTYKLEIEGFRFPKPILFQVPNDSNTYDITSLITSGSNTTPLVAPFVSQLVAGSNISLSPAGGQGVVTISASGSLSAGGVNKVIGSQNVVVSPVGGQGDVTLSVPTFANANASIDQNGTITGVTYRGDGSRLTGVATSATVTKIVAGDRISVSPASGLGNVTIANTGTNTQVVAGNEISISPSTGFGAVTVSYAGTHAQIIAGSQISVSPSSGFGAVTVSYAGTHAQIIAGTAIAISPSSGFGAVTVSSPSSVQTTDARPLNFAGTQTVSGALHAAGGIDAGVSAAFALNADGSGQVATDAITFDSDGNLTVQGQLSSSYLLTHAASVNFDGSISTPNATIDANGTISAVTFRGDGSRLTNLPSSSGAVSSVTAGGQNIVVSPTTGAVTVSGTNAPQIVSWEKALHTHQSTGQGGLLDAIVINTGTLATSRLAGNGLAHATSYLRGDQTWAELTLNPPFVTLTDAGTVTWAVDPTVPQQNAQVTLGGNRVLSITGATSGFSGVLKVTQDATGTRTLGFIRPGLNRVINGGQGAIPLTIPGNSIDILSWIYDGNSYFWTGGKNFN